MPLFSAPRWIRYPSSSKPIFCTSRLLRQDMSGSTHLLLPLYPGIPPHQFWCHSDSPVLRQTARPSIITLSPVGSCKSAFLKNSSFKQSPSVARPFKNLPLHRFSVNRHKNNSRILRARCFIIFGTRLVRRKHTFDRRSLHSFLREYSSELESSSSFIFHLL